MINFRESAKRHYNDAELLLSNTRQANAGQLYGFAAECGLKALLIWHGYSPDPAAGDIDRNYHIHINRLVNNVASSLSGRGADKYLSMIPSISNFSTWTIEHRYWLETALPNNITNWRSATIEVMNMLDQAITDGVVR
jgi:hypothetical protein